MNFKIILSLVAIVYVFWVDAKPVFDIESLENALKEMDKTFKHGHSMESVESKHHGHSLEKHGHSLEKHGHSLEEHDLNKRRAEDDLEEEEKQIQDLIDEVYIY